MKVSVAFLFLACCLLAGCETPIKLPSHETIQASDPGPIPADWEKQIRAFWASNLIDPTAPIYEFGEPRKGCTSELDEGKAYRFVWNVSHTVNSKNSYGGYTGKQSYLAIFYNGRLRVICRDFGDEVYRRVAVIPE